MAETKRALITGITGQDGSYLTELLLDKGYEVHGIIRRSSSFNTERINHIYKVTLFLVLQAARVRAAQACQASKSNRSRLDRILSESHSAVLTFFSPTQDQHEGSRLKLHYGDLADGTVLRRIVEAVKPHEVYNLAAQSHVRVSFLEPEYTADVTGLGALRLLDVLRDVEENLGWKVSNVWCFFLCVWLKERRDRSSTTRRAPRKCLGRRRRRRTSRRRFIRGRPTPCPR